MKTLLVAAAAILIAMPALAQSTSTTGANKAGTTQDGSMQGNNGSSMRGMSHNDGSMSSNTAMSSKKSKKHHTTAMQGDMSGSSNGMSQSGNSQTGTQNNANGR